MGTFKDSLKKWFFTNNSSAASATARVAMLDASGNPIGSDTMSNLASVLGVACVAGTVWAAETVATNDDLNNLTERGCYRCKAASVSRTVTNKPSDSSDLYGFSVINIQPYGGVAFETQIFIQLGDIWTRYVTASAQPYQWSTWKKIAFVQ